MIAAIYILTCLFIFLFISLMVPVMYDTNPNFRYHLKFTFLRIIVQFSRSVFSPLICLSRVTTSVPKLCFSVFQIISKFVSKLYGIRWTIEGKENLEVKSGIIVLNCQSMLDILGMVQAWPADLNKISFEVTNKLYNTQSRLASLRCHYANSFKPENLLTVIFKKEKDKMPIFSNNPGPIYHLDHQILQYAIDNKFRIIAIVFSDYYFLDEKKQIFDPGEIIIKLLPAFSAHHSKNANVLNDGILSEMSKTFHDLNGRVKHVFTK